MGHFHGIATRIKVRENTQAETFFNELFHNGTLAAFSIIDVPLDGRHCNYILSSVHNDSAYFDAWRWQAIEAKGEYTLFSSRASVRFTASDEFLTIFNYLKDDLLVEEGDIVYREVYETAETEYVIVFIGGEFVVREGYKWVGGEENDNHPSNFDSVKDESWEQYLVREETWFQAWNINQLGSSMKITIIAAIGNQRELGKNGKLLWHIPEDLKHFKRVTSGNAVLMGRKTFESIGRALPGRRNIVITSDVNYSAPGIEVIHSYDQIPTNIEELYVIGGEKVYKDFIDKADNLWITRVDIHLEADVFFPVFNPQEFTHVSDVRRRRGPDEDVDGLYPYWFEYWIRLPR